MSNKKAPPETPISNGAMLTTAEAARTLDTFIIRLSAASALTRSYPLLLG